MNKKTISKRQDLIVCLLLIILVLTVYLQVSKFSLVDLDDDSYVAHNPHVQIGFRLDNIRWAFNAVLEGNWMPATWMSYMADTEIARGLAARGIRLGQGNSGVYHLTNMAQHLLSSLLLFFILLIMTGSRWRSAFVAAVFAIHPLHVESVAWVAERKDTLSALFWMLTILAYLNYVRRPGFGRYVLIMAAFALGLMAKSMLVTLPVILLLMDFWPLGRFNSERKVWPMLKEKLPLFALSVGAAMMAFFAQGRAAYIAPDNVFPIGVRLANAFVSFIKYIGLTILPRNLSVCYVHPGLSLPTWAVVLSAIFVVGFTILAIRFARRVPYLAIGWLWFIVTLLPVIGIVQIADQALADRYSYIPMIGLLIMAAWGIPNALARFNRPMHRFMLTGAACAIVVLLASVAHTQVGYWRDSLALYSHVVKVNPHSRVGYSGLGSALEANGRQAEAMKCFRKSIDIAPRDVASRVNLGISLATQGKLDEASSYLKQALEMSPGDPRASYNLGMIFVMQNKLPEASEQFSQAVFSQPSFTEAHIGLANVSALQGKITDAATHYLEAIRLNPKDPVTHLRLAGVLEEQGEIPEAISQYREVLRLNPNRWDAANNLAWILATQSNPSCANSREAIALAKIACRLTKQSDAQLLDTLSTAYAADGRYNEAASTTKQALSLIKSAKQAQIAKELRTKLRLYQSRCSVKS